MSHEFWKKFLLEGGASSPLGDKQDILARSALGFLRTYVRLIYHYSDYKLAIKSELLPSTVTFEDFCNFSSGFHRILDTEVLPRYHFGELRLTRLNFWSKIFLHRWEYETINRQYSSYFARFYAPILFAFGAFSVILSAIQVELAVEPLDSLKSPRFLVYGRVFGIMSLVAAGGACLLVLLLLVGKLLAELQYALRDKKRKKKEKANHTEVP